jgi:hypothetical protein
MKTFFWGFFSTPWKRLSRTLSILFTIFFLVRWYNIPYWDDEQRGMGFFICCIPLLSYLIEPFVKYFKKTPLGSKNHVIETVVQSSNNKKSLTEEEIREKGRRFLEELQKKGPDLSKVGKTVVHLKGSSKTDNIDDEFDYPDKTREFRKLKIDIMKEFPRGNDSKKDNE